MTWNKYGATNMEKYVWTDAQDMGNLHTQSYTVYIGFGIT